MKRALFAAILLAPFAVLANEAASPSIKGNAEAGAAKAAPCVACHGVGGSGSINPEWPKLAGQHAGYITKQLGHFKSGERKQAVMMGQATLLADQDMADVAAYFASLKPVPGVASKDALKLGGKLYRAGDASRGIPACGGCHGPKGSGNPTALYPRIGGQNPGYVAIQLASYKKGKDSERGAGKQAQIMEAVAAQLTDADIAALSSYVSGLQ